MSKSPLKRSVPEIEIECLYQQTIIIPILTFISTENVDIYVLYKKVFNAFREIKAFHNGTSSA